MTIIKKCCLIIFMLLFTQIVFAKTPSETMQLKKIAANYLKKHSAEEHISAVEISVYTPDQNQLRSVYAGTMGFYQNTRLTSDSLFQAGSIVKSMVAALILKLESNPANHLSLDDPIDKYFPEYPAWHAVTIKNLLNMTSGIPDYLKDPAVIANYAETPYAHHGPMVWVKRMYRQPLLFKPGTKFNYSNSNYILLGLLIEKLSRHSLAEEIKNNFILPLQLKHTFYIEHQPSSAITLNMVRGYQFERGFLNYIPLGTDVTDFSLSYLDAAGGLISNSSDVAKWTLALFTPGKVLTPTQLEKLTTLFSIDGEELKTLSPKNNSAYGFGVGMNYSPILHKTIYMYQGMTFGYRAIYVYVPERKVVISVAVNSSFDGKENHLLQLINQVGALVIT